MNTYSILFTILALVFLGLAAYFAINFIRLRKQYAPLRSAEEEAEKVRLALQNEQAQASQASAEQKAKLKSLAETYKKAKATYDQLQSEVNLLEEHVEDISCGLYKPHYSFDSSEQFKSALEKVYEQKKTAIRGDSSGAVIFRDDIAMNGNLRDGKKLVRRNVKLILRAFNGECDAAVAKVGWNNVTRMEERILKSWSALNEFGSSLYITIRPEYKDLCLNELHLAYEYEQKKHYEKEEQRAIKEQMREEERVQRELEKARRDAAAEKARVEKALAEARNELQKASGEHLAAIEKEIEGLEHSLADAQSKQDRAVAMAQITKMGHVYVISNVGSFGEDVFKIGMTRRLEPEERVQELGGASVPYGFDIHAMIFSDDAPALETAFHTQFAERRLNLVNPRKEFFRINWEELVAFSKEQGVTVEFTKLAEAKQFRESEAIRLKAAERETAIAPLEEDKFPEDLLVAVGEDED